MENKERNIEDILLKKAYHELTAEEYLAIKETITSETEYNDMRTILFASIAYLDKIEEIEPKNSTEKFLMEEFSRIHPAKSDQSMGLGFLFPKGRSFYQQPGFQILAIAAMLVLIFTIYPKLSNKDSNGELAYHQTVPSKDKGMPLAERKDSSPITVADGILESEEINDQINDQSVIVQNNKTEYKNLNSTLRLEDEALKKSTIEEKPSMNFATNNETYPVNTEGSGSGLASTVSGNTNTISSKTSSGIDAVSEKIIAEDFDKESDNYLATTPAVNEMADDEINNNSNANIGNNGAINIERTVSAAKKDIPAPLVKKSKSLAENSELIDLFYTAM
ncbi:MAG: hypothetical protein H6600_08500 [Flavobacteriales bacterium]|nr:hypothetical protein [Flavobacteriales bacterium]MCB9198485.1 hypothetical protein [Flavobacteriales bacterium]